jgi:hypothetical protein
MMRRENHVGVLLVLAALASGIVACEAHLSASTGTTPQPVAGPQPAAVPANPNNVPPPAPALRPVPSAQPAQPAPSTTH